MCVCVCVCASTCMCTVWDFNIVMYICMCVTESVCVTCSNTVSSEICTHTNNQNVQLTILKSAWKSVDSVLARR